jgi:hypothetical protein
MSLSRLTNLSIIGVFALACDSADDITGPPPTGFAFAGATYECVGPLSESGVAIYLATKPVQSLKPSAPYARIIIRQSIEALTERPWLVAGSGAQGHASYHSTATNQEIATSGAVTINAVDSDNTIEGWADVTFPNAGRVGGNFRAFWLPPTEFCL